MKTKTRSPCSTLGGIADLFASQSLGLGIPRPKEGIRMSTSDF